MISGQAFQLGSQRKEIKTSCFPQRKAPFARALTWRGGAGKGEPIQLSGVNPNLPNGLFSSSSSRQQSSPSMHWVLIPTLEAP